MRAFILAHLSLVSIVLTLSASDAQAQLIEPVAATKIAFIGDTGMDSSFRQVLRLIESEQADMVVHLGDFDYADNPKGFESIIDAELGETFPYLVVPGNHDNGAWKSTCSNGNKGCYATVFGQRYVQSGIPLTKDQLDNEMYTLEFQGIFFPVVGARVKNIEHYAAYLEQQLATRQHQWIVCSWHLNQQAMQVGGKTDQMGWPAYDSCLQAGAIIATAHEHSYQCTKTLTALHTSQGVVVNPLYPDPQQLFVYPGSTFAFVSGAGGNGMRNQERCLPTTYPYGCNGEWASIYTSNQQAQYGALFIDFYPANNPNQAQGYFKNIANEVVDTFTVTSITSNGPLPTLAPTVTSAPVDPSPDADGDDDVDIFDFNALMSVFGLDQCGNSLDLNSDCSVNLIDYNLFLNALKSWWG